MTPVSMLFVPGSRPEMIAKAATSAADAVCIDLEDAVAPAEKPAARGHAVQALRTLDFGRRTRVLRINAVDTPFAYRDLVDVIEAAGDRVDTVMLPKASSADDIRFVATMLDQLEQHVGLERRIGIEAQIETAGGFIHIAAIASASPRLRTLIFGQGDYSASMRMPAASIGERDEHDELYPGHRYHAVMHAIVAAARANGLGCLDGPYAVYKDAEGLERACRMARALGFDGKQCIHPAQVAVVAKVFAPTAAETAHAEGVVAAYDAAIAAGAGSVSYQGKMIDAASVRMARALLARRR
jgi:citrate lyase beta subunit